MANAQKYKDTMSFHTSGAAHALQKLKESISVLDIPDGQRLAYEALVTQGFELGYSAAKEEERDDYIEHLKEFVKLNAEQQKVFIDLLEKMNNVEYDYVGDSRKLFS